jgi:hypothetical protein
VLLVAIEYNEGLIDAYRTELRRRSGVWGSVIAKENKGVADRWKRDIEAWRKILLDL